MDDNYVKMEDFYYEFYLLLINIYIFIIFVKMDKNLK